MTEPPAAPGESPRILIAEDEPHIQRILITLLDARGLEWEIAQDGAAALDALRGVSRYDLVLLDIVMPHQSGVEVLTGLREMPHRANLPVIVLTAKGQEADRERAISLGVDRFLTKPFSPRQLLKHIDVLLNRD